MKKYAFRIASILKLSIVIISCATTQSAMDSLIARYGNQQHGWVRPSGVMKENPQKADARSLENGRRLYHENCAPCHGAQGRGDGILAESLNPKPQNLRDMRGDRSDYHIFLQISLGSGDMPRHSQWDENAKWDIVNYVQAFVIKDPLDQSL